MSGGEPDPEVLARVADGLLARAGHRYNPEHPQALWSALHRRARVRGATDRHDYVARLLVDEAEWHHLAEETAVHETSFFRHAGQFRALTETVLPELVKRRHAEKTLRVWSSACATGEEPYSIAIALSRLHLPKGWKVEVVATDLSHRALGTAQKAVFEERRLRSLPPGFAEQYFDRHGAEHVVVKPEIRALVTFRPFNLTGSDRPPWLQTFDLVFCENVLIYFTPEATRRVIDLIRDVLHEGGYLFLGYSETLYGMSEGFTVVSHGDAFIYRRTSVPTPPATGVRSGATAARPERRVMPRSPSPPPPTPAARPAASASPKAPERPKDIPALVAREDFEGAIHLAEERLQKEPGGRDARFLLARLYAARERRAEAAHVLRLLLSDDPLHAPSYVLLGALCERQGEISEAIAELKRALYLYPKLQLAWLSLGNLHQKRGELKDAVHAYRQALKTAGSFVPEWDHAMTKELLVRTCEQSVSRLARVGAHSGRG